MRRRNRSWKFLNDLIFGILVLSNNSSCVGEKMILKELEEDYSFFLEENGVIGSRMIRGRVSKVEDAR